MTVIVGILTVVGLMGVCGLLVALAIADLERRQERWKWNHPPEDDDGIREDDADE